MLLIASPFFLVNPLIAAHMLPHPSLIANIHSVPYPHTLSTLNDDGSYGSTICPPSIIMSPMDPHYVPLNDDGSRGSLQSVPPQLL